MLGRLLLPGAIMATLLIACSPTATTTPETPYLPPSTWTGPIETIALVMSRPDEEYRPLANSALSLSLVSFARHPYARQRFDVIERSEIDRIMGEHRLASGGFVDLGTAPQLGQLLGARYILVLELVSFDIRQSSGGGSLGDLLGLDVDVGVSAADLAVSLMARLVDVTTGRVLATGYGENAASVFLGVAVDEMNFSSEATMGMVTDLIPQAATRAFNALFRQLDA